ncbi:MAG TPA: glycosyltransferase [Opitutaceae bacterium]|nr:glycosyltransferase [Opitutaceae bacterium]
MKILVLQDWLRSGGTERQSVLLANGFAAAGHGTTLLTFRPGGRLAPTVAAAVGRRALQPFDLRLDWYAPGLSRAVGVIKPDVILCMGRMANCYAGRLQREHPDAAVLATMRTGKPLPALFRRSLRLVRHVVANSREARDGLITRHAVPPARISVIYNSLVFGGTTAPHARPELRARYGASDRTLVLLCVAMFRPEKNQRELIEIAAGFAREVDWQLWLAGDGPARRACEKLAATRGVAERVRFPGFLRDPSPLYAASDVAVHASSSESLSNFLIEAQAQGLPAVAYEAQGIAECFVPGQTGWPIPRGDRAAFRQRLGQLAAASPTERASRSDAARRYARETFDADRQIAAYLDLFQSLANQPPSRGDFAAS